MYTGTRCGEVLFALLNKPGAARYKVVGNKLEVLNDIGDVDSTNSLVLEKFIETTVREYPSKGYSLILSSHGGSWRDRERLYQRINGKIADRNYMVTYSLGGDLCKYAK